MLRPLAVVDPLVKTPAGSRAYCGMAKLRRVYLRLSLQNASSAHPALHVGPFARRARSSPTLPFRFERWFIYRFYFQPLTMLRKLFHPASTTWVT